MNAANFLDQLKLSRAYNRSAFDGVQLPPLHPRCRCTIHYREVKPQRFGAYEDQVRSHGGSGNVKPDKIIAGHDRPRTAEPLNIIDHLDKNGKIDKRAFYDENGRMYLEIHTTNHGNPKNHPFGSHGEHAHAQRQRTHCSRTKG